MLDFWIDDRGFIWVEDFRLPLRVDIERGIVEFLDKDKRRSDERGSRFVEVPAGDMVEIFKKISDSQDEIFHG